MINALAYGFLVLMIVAAYHFIYEGVIAPSLRWQWRWELFALRDRLRRLKADHPDEVSDELFQMVQGMLNNSIILLHKVNVKAIEEARERYEKSERLTKRYERFSEMLTVCPLDDVKTIPVRAAQILNFAMIVNHGGWLIYIIPIGIGFDVARKIRAAIPKAAAMPEPELTQISALQWA